MRALLRSAGYAGLPWAALLIVFAGCDSLTNIDAPDVIEPGSLETPAGALALRAGALRRFGEMLPGGGDGLVLHAGLVADEIISGEASFYTATDARRDGVTSNITDGTWARIGTARQSLLQAIPYMLQYQPTQLARVGELYALVGFTETFLGENVCAGAPLSRAVGGQPIYGASLTTAQLFDSALVHLDSAVTLAADSARFLDLARVGRARTLLDLGRVDEAAAAVAAVPTSFVYHAEFNDAAQQNRIFANLISNYGVADREGTNGLDFVSAADPRVPTEFVNTGLDGLTPIYRFTPYATTSAPIVVASGREARLIEAEAALRRADVATWLATLNALRAGFTPALDPLTDPGTDSGRVDLMFRERSFWLFLTAHRLGDLRRLITQYSRVPESVFPTGVYKDGSPYGSATYIALPPEAQFNPNFTGCDVAAP